METSSEKYLCPFCVSTWDCDGPHIEEQHLGSFSERIYYMREDLALLAKEMIHEFSEAHGHDLKELETSVYEKLINRPI
jgi:hypothetical protein